MKLNTRAVFWSILLLLSGGKLVAQGFHRYHFRHPQMGTIFQLVFYTEKDSIAAASIAGQVFGRIDSLNAIFSDWLPESELNQLCKTAGSGAFVSVSPELFDVLQQARQFSQKSNGAFDVSVGPLTRLWRRSRNLKELPLPEMVEQAQRKVNWRWVELQKKGKKVRLLQPGMALDLGGIAQGWTADDCLALLKSKGIQRAMIDAGGDIALGEPPPGEKAWKIEAPTATGENKNLYLKNCGITTSGATFRYLELDGVRYSHIVDPRTGRPLTHRTLVTVLAKNATTADAWATAISVMGQEGWQQLKRKSRVKVWLAEMPL